MSMSDRIQPPSRHEPEYWVKSPGANDAFGPVGPAKLALLINAAIVRDDSLISDGDSDFQPVGAVKLKVLATPEVRVISNPKVVRREPVKPEAPVEHAGENRFASGYEVNDVLRFNRMMEKEPQLHLPPWWKDARVRDRLRFTLYGSIVTGVFFLALHTLCRYGAMDKVGIASAAWALGMGLVWLIVFFVFPTRHGF